MAGPSVLLTGKCFSRNNDCTFDDQDALRPLGMSEKTEKQLLQIQDVIRMCQLFSSPIGRDITAWLWCINHSLQTQMHNCESRGVKKALVYINERKINKARLVIPHHILNKWASVCEVHTK